MYPANGKINKAAVHLGVGAPRQHVDLHPRRLRLRSRQGSALASVSPLRAPGEAGGLDVPARAGWPGDVTGPPSAFASLGEIR